MARAAVVVLGLVCGVAHADPYPEAEVDRPLLRPAGMTALDISLDLPTYRYAQVQPDGTTKVVNTAFASHRELDLGIEHGFSGVELLATFTGRGSDGFLSGEGAVQIGQGDVFARVTVDLPTRTSSVAHEVNQQLGYGIKQVLMPGLLSVAGSVSAGASEIAYNQDGGSGARVFGELAGDVTVQLLPRLALQVGPVVVVPLGHSAAIAPYATTLRLFTQVELVLGHWDLYAQFFADDITHTTVPSASLGFVHRWGNGD